MILVSLPHHLSLLPIVSPLFFFFFFFFPVLIYVWCSCCRFEVSMLGLILPFLLIVFSRTEMANNRSKEEPSTAPQPDRWYNLNLGSSFNDNSPTKFCTLRYEFKPASIDKSQPGSLHKSKDNKVMVEFHNNQPGKPNVSFEGSSEDYKDNDAVLFFDGETFRLERLHRAVKRLRHVRLPGESTASAATVGVATSAGQAMDSRSPPLGKTAKPYPSNNTLVHSLPVEVERIDVGESESPGGKVIGREVAYSPPAQSNVLTESQDRNLELEEHLHSLFEEDDDIGRTPDKVNAAEQETNPRFDIDVPNQNGIDDVDDEIADVDVSDDEADTGANAAEALRAQVNAEGAEGQSSSSSGTSRSGSSGSSSGSASSSSDSEASNDDSVSSI